MALLAQTLACSDGRIPLTIYSPHGRDHLTLLEHEFERLHPEVDVRWLDLGSQEVLDRLRLERVNPQADIWFGGPDNALRPGGGGVAAHALSPELGPESGLRRNRSDDLYYPVYRTPAIIAYNKRGDRRLAGPEGIGTMSSSRAGGTKY